MKPLSLLLASAALLAPLAACSGEPSGELDEVSPTGPEAQKDDGTTQLVIFDTLAWDGHDTAVTKVFTSADAFEAYFDKAAPPEVDFAKEWAIYYAAGPRTTGGYAANVVSVQRSASGQTLTIKTELVSPGNTCAVTEVTTSPATLVTIQKQGPETKRFQARKTGFALACSAVCGKDLTANLEYGARGATYYSESDEPYTPVLFPGAATETLTKERMLALLHRSPSTNIDVTAWADWIGDLTTVEPGATDREKAAAQEYEQLRAMVELQLTDIQVFDVGFDDNGDGVRPLYIIGRTACGDLAGLKTLIVAT